MLAPPVPLLTLGGNILISWDGSQPAATALGRAQPFIRKAERVVVLDSAQRVGRMSPEQLLRDAAVEPETIKVDASKSEVGTIVLETAAALKSDLLIWGAYSSGPSWETIFGGPSDRLFHEARLPVLVSCAG